MIQTNSITIRAPRLLRNGSILRVLGLPRNARQEDALPKIKERIVAARLRNDDEAAAQWSEVQSFVKQSLPHLCPCGELIGGGAKTCRLCNQSFRGQAVAERHAQARALKAESNPEISVTPLKDHIEKEEVRYLAETVTRCGGNKSRAALSLGISITTLFRKLAHGRKTHSI